VIPSVAGCTTGSLYPRRPYIRDEVLSLYSKPCFCLQGAHYSRCDESSVLHSTMCPKAQSMGVVMTSMEKVARSRWFSLASTKVSFQRLAAYLPGLVCPYRQAGHFARCLENLTPASFFSAAGVCFATSRALLTNFSELRTREVRRIFLPRTPLNK
jgi:hypothetical protein